MLDACKGCGLTKKQDAQGQWWNLNNYFGFTGRFCASCYDKVSHDAWGNPSNPKEHLVMTLKLLAK